VHADLGGSMPLPQATTSNEPAAQIAGDALVVGAFATDGGVRIADGDTGTTNALDGYLDDLGTTGFRARFGDVLLVPTLGKLPARLVAVVGLGPEASATRATICGAAAAAAKKLSESTEISSVLHLALDDPGAGRAAVEGFILGAYRFVEHRSDPKPSKLQRVIHAGVERADLELGVMAAEGTCFARDLINEPANVLTPRAWARRTQDAASVYGLECEIFDETELERRGFGGILATAGGSDEPPRLIQVRYSPPHPTAKIVLVGKGVTFDSGGLSLKPAASMELMKTDMSGGAVVIAVMTTLQRLGITAEVEAIVPATENMTGGGAMKPGDVIVHYGGRTTEVTNTDAEGRLVLVDALAYASERSPDTIIDVATLTGSTTVALGKKASALFCDDDGLRDEILEAAAATGERTWQLPLYEDYLSELDSDVADHKNSGIRWGGAIIAAMFLKRSVGSGIRWAHLDIAGTGRSERDYLDISRGGTGVPVRTLIEWLRRWHG
jgi:leucyl aminopeptidase